MYVAENNPQGHLQLYSMNDRVNITKEEYLTRYKEFEPSSSSSFISSTSYTNCIFNSTFSGSTQTPYFTSGTATIEVEKSPSISTNFALTTLPLYFGSADLVKVPSKIIYAIERKIPKKVLSNIHSDIRVAQELCLLFISQLTSTYFEIKTNPKKEGWKSLKSNYLMELIGVDSTCYKRVRKVLEYPLTNGPILECDYKKISGAKNYYYRIGSWYLDKKVHAYKLQTADVKKSLYKHYLKAYARASENVICRNLFNLYINLELPTNEEIEFEASRLIKEGFKNKKGKKLTRRNKHSNSYFKKPEDLTFVEDAIEIYNYLTNDKGILIPTIGGESSGGRIVDSFTLMPGWIRNLCTINGKKLVECDYSCLHPNIAMSLYGGNSKFLTHKELATHLQIDIMTVKTEHLSFFNKKVSQMKQSPLFAYYQEKEPKMLSNLIADKNYNDVLYKKERHKITSRKLFKKEVKLMTDVIVDLNKKGIYVMYVYDALYCEKKHAYIVNQTMNHVAISHGIYTVAK